MNRDMEPSRFFGVLAKSRHSPGLIADHVAQQLGQNSLHGIGHVEALLCTHGPGKFSGFASTQGVLNVSIFFNELTATPT